MAFLFRRWGTPLPHFRLRLRLHQVSSRYLSAAPSVPSDGGDVGKESPLKSSLSNLFRALTEESAASTAVSSAGFPPPFSARIPGGERSGDAEKDDKRLLDIDSAVSLAREILHSSRYENLEPLTEKDEKTVVEKLLRFHPNRDEKIGCGIEAITVDWHSHFRSRCFYVVRTDGSSIDFSYRKCVQGYSRYKREVDLEKRRSENPCSETEC